MYPAHPVPGGVSEIKYGKPPPLSGEVQGVVCQMMVRPLSATGHQSLPGDWSSRYVRTAVAGVHVVLVFGLGQCGTVMHAPQNSFSTL